MNIYIKYQSSYLPVYWIKRNNHNITGWFSGNMYQSMFFPNVKDIDIHFTYPKNGRLHYTIISNSSNLEERFFVNNIEKIFHFNQGIVWRLFLLLKIMTWRGRLSIGGCPARVTQFLRRPMEALEFSYCNQTILIWSSWILWWKPWMACRPTKKWKK